MSQPWGLRWRSSTFFIILVVGAGIFTDLFLYSIVVPVFPFLLRDRLGIEEDKIQFYVSMLLGVFGASSFLFSPIAGYIADKISNRQKPFLVGLIALLLSTLGLAFGENITILAIARVFQGMSSAVVWTVGLAICLETVGPSKLGTTIGTVSFSFPFHASLLDIGIDQILAIQTEISPGNYRYRSCIRPSLLFSIDDRG
jgi:MFS family permease